MTLQPIKTAGDFSAQVRIEKLAPVVVDGTLNNEYETLACVGAEVKSRGSLTIKQADRITEGATHLVTIRYRPDVRGADRLVLLPSGRVFQIRGIPRGMNEPNPTLLELDCVETR